MPGLRNPRWELFAQNRALNDFSVQKAYVEAGGRGNPKHQGNKLSKKPEVRARVAELLEERKERFINRTLYEREDVIRGLWENIHSAMMGAAKMFQGEPCYVDGKLVIERDHKAINAAYQLLGLEIGMFPKESKVLHGRIDPLQGLTLDETLDFARRALYEVSDGQIDVDIDLLRAALGADEGGGEAPPPTPVPAALSLQALSEAGSLPRGGESLPGTPDDRGEPGGEDVGGGV